MSRGSLSVEVLTEIGRLLPDLTGLEGLIRHLDPGLLSSAFPHESRVPVACVCFSDVFQTLSAVRYALHEFHAHGRWYRERNVPNETAAVFFERFYLEDAAFRLYSGGEDLASALQAMLEVQDATLARHREKRSSLQAQVGTYLIKERPDDTVTAAVKSLVAAPAWGEAMRFRNEVVHEQAPSMEGFGITYERRQRWEPTTDGFVLRVGGGDPPRWTSSALATTMHAATRALVTLTIASVARYREILSGTGHIQFTDDGLSVNIG